MTQAPVLTPRNFLILVLVACAFVAPLFFLPLQSQQSWWNNVNWVDQFTDQLRAGHLYPRWLPDSHGGGGAPTFYFYAPLPFYVAAIPNALGLSNYWSVVATFGTGSVAMGSAMLLWLRGSRRPLLGSLLFMLLPYTVIDFYLRAAIGEFVAIVFIPLLALALRDRRPVLLAISYAGLILSHLPLALLVSIFFVAPYGLMMIAKDRDRLLPTALGLAAGLLLAGIYVVPALLLQKHILVGALFTNAHFTATEWLIGGSMVGYAPFSTIIYAVMGFMGLSALLVARQQPRWAIAAIAILALVTVGYGIWSLPLIEKVQFPWRALPIAGFALATAFAHARAPLWAWASAAPLLVASATSTLLLERKPLPLSDFTQPHQDANEYLPAAAPVPEGQLPRRWALEQDGVFYFPSLGPSEDGVFLDGEPELRMLDEEKIGLALSLLGLLLTAWLWRGPIRRRAS
ncbi:hypothetical protein [Sphingomicrobium clamense]|uniref:Membrane protein 6-pyruvoyl-tetrahydropterin synthase-related domain-containing protein n=1 Tax=Sphingomicrobium clamense TaxID=2851013 RepID=A0ABS6V474_9SPHN|nr:hypothetical protein [Sphingomicrobium sp. B8]MBW0144351.1 hypothetical protein [Sphingomicrobium sp. B8]